MSSGMIIIKYLLTNVALLTRPLNVSVELTATEEW